MGNRLIAGGDTDCLGGNGCPTVFETDRGTFLIQGFKLSTKEREDLALPGNEDAVEVPRALVEQMKQALGETA